MCALTDLARLRAATDGSVNVATLHYSFCNLFLAQGKRVSAIQTTAGTGQFAPPVRKALLAQEGLLDTTLKSPLSVSFSVNTDDT